MTCHFRNGRNGLKEAYEVFQPFNRCQIEAAGTACEHTTNFHVDSRPMQPRHCSKKSRGFSSAKAISSKSLWPDLVVSDPHRLLQRTACLLDKRNISDASRIVAAEAKSAQLPCLQCLTSIRGGARIRPGPRGNLQVPPCIGASA